jgi:transposase
MSRPEMPMPKLPPDDAKRQSLREQGTLNPRPQAVTDHLFTASEFFDPRDLVQVKYEMLRRVEKEGRSISEAATRFGFSRPSFYQAQAAFQTGGLARLVPRKRGPKKPHKITAEVLEFIREARQKDPSLRTTDLVSRTKERFHLEVHPRTLERGWTRRQKKPRKRG